MQPPKQKSTISLLRAIWRHLGSHRHKQFGMLLILTILVSFAEIISIGSIMPFLSIFMDPQYVFNLPMAQPWINFFEISNSSQLLFFITVIFGISSIGAGIARLTLLWFSSRLTYDAGVDLSIGMYRRALYQSYAVHVARTSSEMISVVNSKSGAVISAINATLMLIGSLMLLITILVTLISIDPFIAFFAFSGFGMIYIAIIKLTKKRQYLYSVVIAEESTQVIKSLQEGLGGIRDILIDGTQETYCQIYQDADKRFRRAQGNSQFIVQSPRYLMEALGMTLIALLAYTLAMQDNGMVKAIPILGTFALGAQRLLPIMQQAYLSWSSIQGSKASLEDALRLLDEPLPEILKNSRTEKINFSREVSLRNLGFRYSKKAPWVFRNLNLNIPKGSRIGFIGQTGSGKSTLLDIVMGLLQPSEGEIRVDGIQINVKNNQSWRANIAHVPQAIFLADRSVMENIAFGIPRDRINFNRVVEAAKRAQISEAIEGWEHQYGTLVGERGVRLSGGQRQRIGIARALYKKANIIIFDEATSSLDNETEEAVMDAIDKLDSSLTLLIIAHRTSTLQKCDKIIEIGNQGIQRIGTYEQVICK